jgi:hypothetical protein
MKDDTKCYLAWRRSEAYAIPVTDEGEEMAAERYRQFKKGFYSGLNWAAFELEQLHRKEKHLHKFYLVASDTIRNLLK